MGGGARSLVALVLAGMALGCAGRLQLPERPTGDGPFVITGRVSFAFRPRGIRGFGVVPASAPARFVHVCAIDADDGVVAVAYTDADGAFTLRLRRDRPVVLQVATISHTATHDVRVFEAPPQPDPYLLRRVGVVPARPQVAVQLQLEAGLGGVQPAGAFFVLDQLVRGALVVRQTATRRLPPVIAYWYLGNGGRHADNSEYSSESAVVPGAYAITILGGSSRQPEATDSDQFDADVILHELGHLVADRVGPGGSIGGDHGDDRRILPIVAFHEGFSTFFSCAVRGDSVYRDVMGLDPTGDSFAVNLEGSIGGVRGIDTEASVEELLWDIADGAGGLPDLDQDGIALGLRGVMKVLGSFRGRAGEIGTIGRFLERMVELRLATDAQVAALLQRPRDHEMRWPLQGRDRWPQILSPPERVQGEIDGRVGEGTESFNDAAAVHAYRVDLAAPAELEVELTIQDSGRREDGSDLDLEVRDILFERLERSARNGAHESISLDLPAGTYFVLVRDGNANRWLSQRNRGNHARYELRVGLDR